MGKRGAQHVTAGGNLLTELRFEVSVHRLPGIKSFNLFADLLTEAAGIQKHLVENDEFTVAFKKPLNLPDMISVRSELEHFGNFRLCGHSDNRKHLMIKRIKVTVTVLETLKAVHQTVQDDYHARTSAKARANR